MKYLSLIIIGFFQFQFSFAQIPTEKTLLWEVSGKGIKKPSYLFGTIHLMCPGEMVMPEKVKGTFATTSELFLEVDMDDPAMMTTMMKGMLMQDNSTIENLLGSKFPVADSIFSKTTGFPLKAMNKAKPLMLMSLIYPAILKCQPQSWEELFMKMAKEKSMEIKGLEELDAQVAVMNKIPYQLQAEQLNKMLISLDSAKMQFDSMLNIYLSKDVNALSLMTENDKDLKGYEDDLLANRNKNWIPVISNQSKKTPTFFAFGAGHLGGKNGIINLLRKNGFTVKPVMY